ncbi:serine O-acetyltransferase EpsC [Planctomicrobium sp. SH661]|uniref:serine O-acetyltransferase EpsC n=1 Tax=Planctomicrobium sp. SH661 TaxID=3448124 RepID=UPI003F5C9CE1
MSQSTVKPDLRPLSDEKWNVDGIVAELRALREQSLQARHRGGRKERLPSKKRLAVIIDRLSTAIFPNRLSERESAHGNIDYFVGHTLDVTLSELAEEVLLELDFFDDQSTEAGVHREEAVQIVRNFAARLPAVRALLESDIEAAFKGDPAARSSDEVLVCYPGIAAIMHFRMAHELFLQGATLVARMISEIAHSLTGIDIHPGASIQGSFFIDHGTGVVIGETAVIGSNVRIYQAVTLGAKRFPTDENGVLLKGNARHPIVEDGVVIYAGATILGRVTIGQGSVIGGNVWLTTSVPPHSNITQAKVRSEIFDSGSGI